MCIRDRFDDCQIQRVECAWIDWNREGQQFAIEIDYMEDLVLSSRNVEFVQFRNGLCFPFDADYPNEIKSKLTEHLDKRLDARQELEAITNDYHSSMYIMPIQRFFHRSRVNGFNVIQLEDYPGVAG